MRTRVKLRYPKEEDVEKLLELDEAACIATTGRPLKNRNRRREMILSVIKDEPHLIRVAEAKGGIVGFGWLGTDPKCDTVTSIAVLPELQRQNVGSKLLIELEKQARKMQMKKRAIFLAGWGIKKLR